MTRWLIVSIFFLLLPLCAYSNEPTSQGSPQAPTAPFPYAGELASAGCACLWAVSTILFRVSGEHINPMSLNLLKNGIGLVLFAVTMFGLVVVNAPEGACLKDCLAQMFNPPNMGLKDWLILLGSGVFGLAIADSLYFASLNRIGAGYSAIVDCVYSPFVVIGAYLYLGEDLHWKLIPAILLILGAILIGTWNPQSMKLATQHKQFRLGILLGILSMFFVALAIVGAKPVLEQSNPFWANAVRMVGGLLPLMFLGCLPQCRQIWQCFHSQTPLRNAITASFFGNYLAMICWLIGMKYTVAHVAGVLNQLSTIFILLLATIVLKEKLTLSKFIAIMMGFAGGVIIALKF